MKRILIAFLLVLNIGIAYAADKTITSLKYVTNQLATKQDEIPAVDTNTVITHTGTAGEIGEKGIYDSTGNYAEQQTSLVTAGDANTGINNALANEFVCIDADTDGTCLIWKISAYSDNQVNTPIGPNMFPPVPNQTQTKNGVTVTVESGTYSLSGVATDDTYFDFELIKSYTFKKSVGSRGTGVMYLWNNKILSTGIFNTNGLGNTCAIAYLTKTKSMIDGWRFSALNRKSADYGTQTGNTAKYVRLYVDNGVNVNGFTFAPMFVEDGKSDYTHFYPYIENIYLPNGQ